MPRKQRPARRGKPRGKPTANTRTRRKTKRSARTKPSAAGRRASSAAKATAKPAMRPLAASVVAPPDPQMAKLYELVCDVEGRMQDGLKLGACNNLAKAHLAKNPDHDCDCFRQGTSDEAITRRFRARAADRERAVRAR